MLPVQRAGLTFTPSDALLLGGARVSRIGGKIDTWVTGGPMRWRHGAAIIGGRRLGMPLAEMRDRSRVFVSLLVFELVGHLEQVWISLSRLESGRWTGMGFLSSESHRNSGLCGGENNNLKLLSGTPKRGA